MLQEKPIGGETIKKAFLNLELSGPAFEEGLVAYLEKRGNILDEKRSFWLKDIERDLAEGLGEDVAKLIVERLRRAIVKIVMT